MEENEEKSSHSSNHNGGVIFKVYESGIKCLVRGVLSEYQFPIIYFALPFLQVASLLSAGLR